MEQSQALYLYTCGCLPGFSLYLELMLLVCSFDTQEDLSKSVFLSLRFLIKDEGFRGSGRGRLLKASMATFGISARPPL